MDDIKEIDYSAIDGIYYKVSEENNDVFLNSLIPDKKGEKTDLKGFLTESLKLPEKNQTVPPSFLLEQLKIYSEKHIIMSLF